jgi:WXG100 family type VII secretion target
MAPSIKVDFEELQKAAKRFHTAGESVDAALIKMLSAADDAEKSWKGQAAGKFFPKWALIRANLEKLINAMYIGENYINETVKIFKEAEEKAASKVRKGP